MKVLRPYLLFAFFAGLAFALPAQGIWISTDPVLEQMTASWVAQNRSMPGIPGWRVQVLASTDRQQVESAKTRFLGLYPDIPADWVHEKPYYKLRAGAFRSRLEARAFIASIQDNFTGCYPAKDPAIPPSDFLQMRQ